MENCARLSQRKQCCGVVELNKQSRSIHLQRVIRSWRQQMAVSLGPLNKGLAVTRPFATVAKYVATCL
jgi:hypothetical protein